MDMRIQVPKCILTALNQLYDMERKLAKAGDAANITRNVNKIRAAFAEEGVAAADISGGVTAIRLVYEDPMGQPFKETRTDLEASISGSGTSDLVVVEVIKPIIRAVLRDGAGEFSKVVQKGIVVVESRKEC
ncbi:MAG: hypothetical protein JSR77_17945 [Planctomycetes bacterium]|nr:hypothetical protein [Planctomycetota bacterium]